MNLYKIFFDYFIFLVCDEIAWFSKLKKEMCRFHILGFKFLFCWDLIACISLTVSKIIESLYIYLHLCFS